MATNRAVFDDKLHWYKDAIIYELHIKAFYDSNNDGIGDFKGLLQKLDYLQDLGVTVIWVLPFYPSPLKDDGYDIADYYKINTNYGSTDDFQQFLNEAHSRNLKVITELVINHTSDQHPWFQRARKAPKGSPEREYYVWSDDPNKYKDVRIIFQDFEPSNWSWDPVAQQYYWHRFFHHQPDLNFDNPLVQEEIFKILDYWCAMGVDGFRLDAVPYLYEREGTNGENLPETHAFLKRLRRHIDEHYPGTCFLAEANMWPEDAASYFGDGDECHMNYHFPVMPRMFMAVQREDRYPITDIFDQTPEIPETCQWAIFLRNHDELTLEMVTDEERDYMYKVYAKDPKARINLGIRHRLAPLMDNDRRKIELMNSLLFSLPGTPVIYYGDEIGMGDNFYLGDRDGVRTPMQWSPDRNAGFSATNPQRLYLPVIIDPQYHYETVNVETHRANTSSLFWYMKRMINMRKRYRAFGRGDFQVVDVDNPKILAFTRTYEDEILLIVVNLSKYSQAAELDLHNYAGYTPMEAFSKNPFPTIKETNSYLLTLGPHSYHWFVLEKKDEKIRSKRDVKMNVSLWSELSSPANSEILLTELLPDYLSRCNWFIGKSRKIYTIHIADQIEYKAASCPVTFLIIEVAYESGLPEQYFLPVAFEKGRKAKNLQIDFPQAIIAELTIGKEKGVLCDALYLHSVHLALLRSFVEEKSSLFNATATDDLKNYLQQDPELRSKMHEGQQLNTSITFDNKLFLKIYRKTDTGVNTDVEISRYLSEANFSHTPKFLGSLELKLQHNTVTLAMAEEMVENHGDGRSFMLERINNYIERILARERNVIFNYPRLGSLFHPLSFDELPEEMKEFLGGSAVELIRTIALRTAQLHRALANSGEKDFQPEEFSLHYQRSLFAGMQSVVREAFQTLEKKIDVLPEDLQQQAKELLQKRTELLEELKKIYSRKFDVQKIRIHGIYGLSEILLTGKDIMIHNFNGNPLRSFSERRIKRSVLRDVAAMIRSIFYVAYEGFINSTHITPDKQKDFLPLADFWAFYMSGFFMREYVHCLSDTHLVPSDEEEFRILVQTYVLENTLHHLIYELNNRPEFAIVPLTMISNVLRKSTPVGG